MRKGKKRREREMRRFLRDELKEMRCEECGGKLSLVGGMPTHIPEIGRMRKFFSRVHS
jgi:hypothetical protein